MCKNLMRFEYILLEDISINDKTFCLSYPLFNEVLNESIKDMGILQPLIVNQTKPYTIVAGFKRIESAIFLGINRLPCLIVDVGQKDAMLMAIHDNLARGFNMVEKALCVDKMIQMGFSIEEIYNLMSIMGLGRHESVIKSLIGIACSERSLKDFIISHKLSMKNIDYLLWFESQERDEIINLLSGVSFTDSLLREILQLLSLIKIKKGILPIDELNKTEDTYEMRKILKRFVNPVITSLEEEFKRIRNLCSFSRNIDIKIDPFFEKEYIDIVIKAKDNVDLEDAIKKIDNALKKGYMEGIFGITKNRIKRYRD